MIATILLVTVSVIAPNSQRKRRGVALQFLSATSDVSLAELPEMHIKVRSGPEAQ
jgi:hypothetical protein